MPKGQQHGGTAGDRTRGEANQEALHGFEIVLASVDKNAAMGVYDGLTRVSALVAKWQKRRVWLRRGSACTKGRQIQKWYTGLYLRQ